MGKKLFTQRFSAGYRLSLACWGRVWSERGRLSRAPLLRRGLRFNKPRDTETCKTFYCERIIITNTELFRENPYVGKQGYAQEVKNRHGYR